jgi:hypothetical protein
MRAKEGLSFRQIPVNPLKCMRLRSDDRRKPQLSLGELTTKADLSWHGAEHQDTGDLASPGAPGRPAR